MNISRPFERGSLRAATGNVLGARASRPPWCANNLAGCGRDVRAPQDSFPRAFNRGILRRGKRICKAERFKAGAGLVPAPTISRNARGHGIASLALCYTFASSVSRSFAPTMPRIAFFLVILPALLLSACARHYRVQGLVLDVNRNDSTMVVSHRAIPGYMDAMAMPFRVRRPSELHSLKRGDQVEFELVVRRRTSLAEKVRAGTSAEVANARRGEALLPLPTPAEKLALGMPVPDFQLINQSARPVRLSDFAGRIVAVNFIYTRCPLPEVCPRLSASFAHLQKRFRERMGMDLALLSITLDSQHDTSSVLADYAKRWGAAEGWQFLTGDTAEIQRIANHFGLVYWPEDGLLTHTSQTGIISRDGRLAALIEGSSYEEDQLGDLIARQLEVSHDSYRHALGVAR